MICDGVNHARNGSEIVSLAFLSLKDMAVLEIARDRFRADRLDLLPALIMYMNMHGESW